jgi:LmbE family N-acetylglucosaminyl deacetylase
MTALARIARGEAAGLRLLVVAAHPDDETIGLGGALPSLGEVTVLHVTDGAPRDGRDAALHGFPSVAAYAAARRAEAAAALALAGLDATRLLSLDVPDQEATLHIVPIAHRIAEAIRARRPDLVVTHAYEGGHPDHDAVACAVHASARLLRDPPPLAEMTGYHAGPEGIATGRFLPPEDEAVTLPLTAETAARKHRMLDCFATQRAVLAAFPLGAEKLRPAPAHDFTAPPHPGPLFYERFPWGMDGVRFRALAGAAMQGLR